MKNVAPKRAHDHSVMQVDQELKQRRRRMQRSCCWRMHSLSLPKMTNRRQRVFQVLVARRMGEYKKGVLYHRLVLMGDASSGYRVSSVWFKSDPYPENPLRLKFDGDIFVISLERRGL